MESKVSSRLKQPLAPEVLQYIFLPRLNREFFANFEMLNQINLAHLVMLQERGILDQDASVRLAEALLKIRPTGRTRWSWIRPAKRPISTTRPT